MGNRVSDLQGSREQARRSHVQLVCLISALAEFCELTMGDSTRLAEILRHRAALLEHIITDQRYYSDYFRVAFYGTFPDAIRNKQFIVRSVLLQVGTALTHAGSSTVPWLRVGEVRCVLRTDAQQASGCATPQDDGRSPCGHSLRQRSVYPMHRCYPGTPPRHTHLHQP